MKSVDVYHKIRQTIRDEVSVLAAEKPIFTVDAVSWQVYNEVANCNSIVYTRIANLIVLEF